MRIETWICVEVMKNKASITEPLLNVLLDISYQWCCEDQQLRLKPTSLYPKNKGNLLTPTETDQVLWLLGKRPIRSISKTQPVSLSLA